MLVRKHTLVLSMLLLSCELAGRLEGAKPEPDPLAQIVDTTTHVKERYLDGMVEMRDDGRVVFRGEAAIELTELAKAASVASESPFVDSDFAFCGEEKGRTLCSSYVQIKERGGAILFGGRSSQSAAKARHLHDAMRARGYESAIVNGVRTTRGHLWFCEVDERQLRYECGLTRS